MTRRAEVVLLCDAVTREKRAVGLEATWASGPYPHVYQDHQGRTITTDADARATNFPAALGPRLFGRGLARIAAGEEPGDEVRFHRDLTNDGDAQAALSEALRSVPVGSGTRVRLRWAEALVADVACGRSDAAAQPAVLALHLTVDSDSLDDVIRVVAALARDRGEAATTGAVRGALTCALLQRISGIGEAFVFPSEKDGGVEGGVYPLMLVERESRRGRFEVQREELYRAAALQTRSENTATVDRRERALESLRDLSVSWSMLVLRNGAAFQLHLPEDDDFRAQAPVYFRTLYTDAVMLAWLQDAILRSWEGLASRTLSRLADRSDLGPARRDAADLDRAVAVDSIRFWMKRSAANTGRAISVLHDAQSALDLPRRLDTVEEQIATLARLSDRDAVERQTRSQEALSTVAMVFAVAVFPVTVTADVVGLLGLSPAPGTVIPVLFGLMAVCGIGAYSLRRFVLRRR